MNRREVLLGWSSVAIIFLMGCVAPFTQDSRQEHKPRLEVFVTNALETPIRVTITASRGSTEFFSHEYDLGPGKGDQSESFVGTPTNIRVSVQDGQTIDRDYSIPASCESPAVNVTIDSDTILVTNGCTS